MTLTGLFPKLRGSKYRVTSDKDAGYNCVAWALGDSENWWEPDGKNHWPVKVKRQGDYSFKVMVSMLKAQGFKECDSRAPESGFEKVAVYAKGDEYAHLARQTDGGWWASKIGPEEDIEHELLEVLEGVYYGAVKCMMRRPIP